MWDVGGMNRWVVVLLMKAACVRAVQENDYFVQEMMG